MYCSRCQAKLGEEEGRFIVFKGKEICVCALCFNEIRNINVYGEYEFKTYIIPQTTADGSYYYLSNL